MTRRIELNDGWGFKESGQTSEWLPVAHVPGTVHRDLQHNGKIPDPFVDCQDLNSRWVAERQWSYRTTFATPSDAGTTVDLVFKGLDTLATVKLNGADILQADNMFVEYRVNVTDKLKPASEDNALEVTFDSALLKGRELLKQHEHEHRFIAHQTEAGRLPIRKAQYHWGWDWGPIIVTAGIWRPVYLEIYMARVSDVWHQSQLSDDLQHVSGKLLARVVNAAGSKVRFTLTRDEVAAFEAVTEVDSDDLASSEFSIDRPDLWYPVGYGAQTRYRLTATIISDAKEVDRSSKFIGFRRAELVQEKDSFGKSFYFRINNIDVFAGGSCWIPADSFLPDVTTERYREWMKLMVQGNQVMIRVWGGGVYEDDAFFDACDEFGILACQDFCFACQSTPTYPSFLGQVDAEARYNVRRLRTHPSLVLYYGNNEDYEQQQRYKLEYNYSTDKDPQSWLKSTFPARYIYEHQLPQIVREENSMMLYHPSSPWGDGKHTTDPSVGDIHQWNIWHGLMNRYQEAASMSGRFVSEFGMEAYPHISTVNSFIRSQSQHHAGSLMLDYHNRAIDHERRLTTYIVENFGLPVKSSLASYIHLTHLVQLDAMRHAYSAWRRQWASRQCGGALVWQLNDCWPTISWAIVDYYLVPKPSFYAIKRALAPISIGVSRPFHNWTAGHVDPTIALTDTSYEVWVASSVTSSQNVNLKVRFISIATGEDILPPVQKATVNVRPNTTTEVLQSQVDTAVQPIAHRPIVSEDASTWVRNQAGEFKYPTKHLANIPSFDLSKHDPFLVYAVLTDPTTGDTISRDAAWPDPIKYLSFPDRGVKVAVVGGTEGKKVRVTAERPVKGFVFQEFRGGGWLSDNGFDVMPGEEQVVTFEKGVGNGQDLRWTYLGATSGEEGLMA